MLHGRRRPRVCRRADRRQETSRFLSESDRRADRRRGPADGRFHRQDQQRRPTCRGVGGDRLRGSLRQHHGKRSNGFGAGQHADDVLRRAITPPGITASGNATGCTPAHTGTVTSVTFTGDGTVLSSTPSVAVTSSGTLSASLNSSGEERVSGRADVRLSRDSDLSGTSQRRIFQSRRSTTGSRAGSRLPKMGLTPS